MLEILLHKDLLSHLLADPTLHIMTPSQIGNAKNLLMPPAAEEASHRLLLKEACLAGGAGYIGRVTLLVDEPSELAARGGRLNFHIISPCSRSSNKACEEL